MDEHIRLGCQLRQRYEEIRRGREKKYVEQGEKYKSLIDPIQSVGSQLKEVSENIRALPTQTEKEKNLIGDVALKYLLYPSGQLDKQYGVYRDNDGLYIGNKQITIIDNDIYLEDEKPPYKGTEGLWELLTYEYPDSLLYNQYDLKNYQEILLKSSAYRCNNQPSGRIKSSEDYKYNEIILPILIQNEIIKTKSSSLPPVVITRSKKKKTLIPSSMVTRSKKGKGLEKVVTNTTKEYVYWDSLDELLDRLYILWGEIKAGNTNPTVRNEIVNIIQEFKEL